MVNIVKRYAPLGPLIWAAVGKNPDSNPMRLIQDIRDTAFGYANEEIMAVRMESDRQMTRDELRDVLETALNDALNYCDKVAPIDFIGHLFVDFEAAPIEADAESLDKGEARAMPIQDFGITLITPD